MLLYVNKKQERQKKIRLLTIVISILFITIANIIELKQDLHTPTASLTTYTPIQNKKSPSNTNSIITLYQTNTSTIKAIQIPSILTKQSSTTIAHCFSKLPKQTELYFTSEVKDKDFLHQIAQTLNLKTTSSNTSKSIIITTNLTPILPLINQEQLTPKTLPPTSINSPQLSLLLDKKFPPQKEPSTTLEKEQLSLQNFVQNHFEEIKNLIHQQNFKNQPFSKQNNLLKNVSLCLKSPTTTLCDTSNKTSFAHKLSALSNKLKSPKTLILLTNFEEITPTTFNSNNGLLFKFEERQTILLPNEITKTPFKTIKQKQGINPDYTNKLMQFYQFKTVEIDL